MSKSKWTMFVLLAVAIAAASSSVIPGNNDSPRIPENPKLSDVFTDITRILRTDNGAIRPSRSIHPEKSDLETPKNPKSSDVFTDITRILRTDNDAIRPSRSIHPEKSDLGTPKNPKSSDVFTDITRILRTDNGAIRPSRSIHPEKSDLETPKKLQLSDVFTDITRILRTDNGVQKLSDGLTDKSLSKRVRRSEIDCSVPDKFHGEYVLQEQNANIGNTDSFWPVPERLTVNKDGVQDDNEIAGSRCLRQVVMEPAWPHGRELLLAFGKDLTPFGRDDDTVITRAGDGYLVAVDKAPFGKSKRSVTGTEPATRQCFYVEWKANDIMHVHRPKDAVNGMCSHDDMWPWDADYEDLQATGDEKHVYVKSAA